MNDLRSLRDDARDAYFEFLVAEAAKSIKSLQPTLLQTKIDEKAQVAASDQMRKALERWFGISSEEFAAWKDRPKSVEVTTETALDASAPDENTTEVTTLESASEEEGAAEEED